MEHLDRKAHAQALIDKGACPACLTYHTQSSNENGLAGFCSRPCHDYYLWCDANFVEVKWRTAWRLAQAQFNYIAEKYGFAPPEEVVL